MRNFYRCPQCQVSPTNEMLRELWGETTWDLAQAHCLRCRVATAPTCHILYFPKLRWLPPALWRREHIPWELRLRLEIERISYLTDGNRVWFWPDFPRAEALCKLTLPTFLSMRAAVKWVANYSPEAYTPLEVKSYVAC